MLVRARTVVFLSDFVSRKGGLMAGGQTWSVMMKGTPASFDPDVFGTGAGEPLKAQIGDLVSWNNQTSAKHQIAVTKADGTTSFTTKEIEGFKSSSPGYVTQTADVSSGTISYHCTLHKDQDGKFTENGKITVVTS